LSLLKPLGTKTNQYFIILKKIKPMKLNRFYYLSFVVISLIVSSCSKTTDPSAGNQYLVSNSSIGEFTREQLAKQVDPQVALFLKNGIKVYRIVYKTTNTDGTTTQASGAILVPTSTDKKAMLSIQHGTISDESQAPSYYAAGSEATVAGSLFASLGYIVVYPDYIGYGASKTLPHTYEHREGLATACIDMLKAAREFVKQENIAWDDRLYLAGYSEGGYATMATLKKLEETAPTEFNIRAVSCGSGAYDKTATMKYILNSKTDGVSGYNKLYLWVLLTYDRIYKLNRPMNTYFKEPYATQIQSQKENTSIGFSLNTIFTDSFLKGINDGTDTAILTAIKDNDIYDWKPKTPLRLYHGDADNLVFYFNSVNAYKAMQAKGATNVEFVTLKGKDHGTAVSDYLLDTYSYFSTKP
jgi:pimeloyl-ACP methyl ester carboxylesterase